MKNRTCIGFSGNKTTLNAAKTTCAAVAGGRLFDGGSIDVTELLVSATLFLKNQNKTKADWFWIDASYNPDTGMAKWSNYSREYRGLRLKYALL